MVSVASTSVSPNTVLIGEKLDAEALLCVGCCRHKRHMP
jgi:hypothetical protein